MAKVPPQIHDPFRPPAQNPAVAEPAAPLPAGTVVEGYTLEATLHEGPHGFVYRARDAAGRPRALKEFFPRHLALRGEDGTLRARQPADAIRLSVALEAFRDESRILASLSHPGLVPVLDTVAASRTLYRVMPLLDGPTLARHVADRAQGPTVGEVHAFIEALLGALAALHAAGVVHGHVEPAQIVLAPGAGSLQPVLLGLGAVAEELEGRPRGPWCAPEDRGLSRTVRRNSASDVYALAACAWTFASGERPPSAEEREDGQAWPLREAVDALRSGPDDVPGARAALAQALVSALAMAPEARPQRMSDLQRLLAGRPVMRVVGDTAPAPLWVGEAPDRDDQRGAIERLPDTPRAAEGAAPPAPAGPASRGGGRRVMALGVALGLVVLLSVLGWYVARMQ